MEITFQFYAMFIHVSFHAIRLVKNYPQTTQQQLLNYLFTNHSSDSRPVRNSSHSLEVKFGIELIHLVALNERHQYITSKLWVRQFWTSELMKWDPGDWDGVTELNLEAGDLWTPDILLYNNADGSTSGGPEKYTTRVTIYSNGLSSWLAPATFSSMCKVNVKHFPFDTQICLLKFGSWAFDTSKLNLTQHKAPVITSQYVNSSTWDIATVKTEFNTVFYACCANAYQDVTFTFVLKRRPLYYVFNIVAPCIVLVLMVLFSFFLPPQSGERLTLNITVILALAFFLQFLTATLPKNSDSTPIVSIFFITLMAESAVALTSTILVLTVYHRGDEYNVAPPPKWTRTLTHPINLKNILHKIYTTIRFPNVFISRSNIHHYEIDIHDDSIHTSVALLKHVEEKIRKVAARQEEVVLYSLQDILQEIDQINLLRKGHDEQEEIQEEWKTLGRALDRLLFIAFLFIFTASAAATLLEVYGHWIL